MILNKWFRNSVWLAIVCCATIPFAAAQERPAEPRVVVRYCSGCHGADGKSQLPYVPKLAGLSASYLESKLTNLREAAPSPVDEAFSHFAHRRGMANSSAFTSTAAVHMVGIANDLSEQDMQVAAQWYSAQTPSPPKPARGRAVEQGRNLYMDGQQSQGLKSCQSCHGPEGHGTDQAPRLAGQHATYLIAQLTQFRAGGRVSPMTAIARSLESNQVHAVARYLQSR